MREKRPKPGKRLSKRETLGLLARLMEEAERAEQQQDQAEPEAVPYPEGTAVPVVPPRRPGLRPADVPVDNSAGPDPAAGDEDAKSLPQELPAQRAGESTRHGTFG
jgi:hypothetical protein